MKQSLIRYSSATISQVRFKSKSLALVKRVRPLYIGDADTERRDVEADWNIGICAGGDQLRLDAERGERLRRQLYEWIVWATTTGRPLSQHLYLRLQPLARTTLDDISYLVGEPIQCRHIR